MLLCERKASESHLISHWADQQRPAVGLESVRKSCSQEPRLLMLIYEVAPNDHLQMQGHIQHHNQ